MLNCFPNSSAFTEKYGLTKREYFAAMAMQAILNADSSAYHKGLCGSPTVYALQTAEDAVKMADALIYQLNLNEQGINETEEAYLAD